MKKFLALTLSVLCLLVLAACSPSATTPVKTSSTIATTIISEPNDVFYVAFCGEYLVPGQLFPKDWLVAPNFAMEPADGQDGVYTYDYLKVTTYLKEGLEYIRSVKVDTTRSGSIPTADGLVAWDDAAIAEQIYGKDAQKEENIWTYRRGSTLLVLRIDSDSKVAGIEYQEA